MSTKTDILQIRYEVTGDGQVVRSFAAVQQELTKEEQALQKNRQALRELQDELDKTGARKREFADKLSKLNAAYDAGAISSGKLRKETIAATADYVKGTAAFQVAAGAVAAGVGVLSAATAIYIRNTIESEKVQAQLKARIRDTGEAAGLSLKNLNDMADAVDRLTDFDDEDVGGVQATLLTFKEIKADNFRGAVDAVLDLSTAMGTDLNSAAVMVGKALQDPVQGVTALRRAGVQLTEDQEKVIEKLVETGKTAEAQRIILAELESQMGTSAEAARDSLGGSLKQLQDDFNNLLEGDAGDNGMVATRETVEGLIDFLRDPGTRQAVDDIASGIASLALACAGLVVDARDAWTELQSLLTLQGDLSNRGAPGGAKTSLKRRQLADIESEQRDREQRGTLTKWADRAYYGTIGQIAGDPLRGESDNELTRRKRQLSASISMDELVGLDDQQLKINWREPLPKRTGAASASASAGRVGGGGARRGGGSGIDAAAREAERARERIKNALADMQRSQDDWAEGLKADTNPIAKEYAERLDKIGDMAAKARKAGVPDAEVKKFTDAMTALAGQYREADIAEHQREFNEETQSLAATMAGPAVEAALEFERALADLDKQVAQGLITSDQRAQRVGELAQKQRQAARDVLAGLDEEIALIGMTANERERYTAIQQAGTNATIEDVQAIEAKVAQLQRMREIQGLADGIGNAFLRMADNIDSGAASGKEALNGFLRDVTRMILQFLAQKALEKFAAWLLGMFGPSAGTAGTSSGNWTFGSTTFGSGGSGTFGTGGTWARGGAFENGVQQFARGAITTGPEYFRHAGGIGMRGEAGAEAIMPLDRGADGKLGVRMTGGGGGGVSIAISSQVNVEGGGGQGDDRAARAFSRQLEAEMEATTMRVLTREQRQGGTLWRLRHGG